MMVSMPSFSVAEQALTFFRYHSGLITTRHHPLSLANARWDEFSYLFFTQDVRRVKKGPTNQIY